MDRRLFLKQTCQIAALASLSNLVRLSAYADSGRRFRYLITLQFGGGWDVILGLDPQEKKGPKLETLSDRALCIGYRPEEILRPEGLRLAPSAAGLAPLAKQCVVVNGVSMLGNISHEDCARWALGGVLERSVPAIPALKAARDIEEGGPRNIVNSSNSNGALQLGGLRVKMKSDSEIVNLQAPSNNSNEEVFLEEDGFVADQERDDARFGKGLAEFKAANPTIGAMLDSSNEKRDMAATVAAFAAGVSRTAHLSANVPNFNLDTHTGHLATHPAALKSGFDRIVALVDMLKSQPAPDGNGSLFDQTLIVATSEFSREPHLNGSSSSSGKEHNGYTNSYLLLGGRLQGGYTVGESVLQTGMLGRPSLHAARNFDFRAGKPIRTREEIPEYMLKNEKFKRQIQPGHMVRTLAEAFGYQKLLDPVLADLPQLPIRF